MHTIAGPFSVADKQKAVAGLLLVMAMLYLVPFVARGWVPLDEGMIGQAAERVLRGGLPHVDYEEPYPGALSYLYALVFKLTGIDLVHLRWTVFAAALASLAFVYAMLRRYLTPVAAAVATWIAMCWSFPNYFSSLPSWWVLLCTLACLWALIRYVETDRILFAAAAGFAAGTAFTIKQTGVYVFPPLVMSLLICRGGEPSRSTTLKRFELAVTAAIGLASFALVLLITRSALGSGELVYLVAPVAASCVAFSLAHRWNASGEALNWTAAAAALAGASAPIAILLLPHVANGSVDAFVNGVFVVPQRRLEFTMLGMRSATQIVAAVAAVLWIFWAPRTLKPRELTFVRVSRWAAGLALAPLATRSPFVYTFIWEAVRGTAAILPLIALWLLLSNRIQEPRSRLVVFASTALLAWSSLVQFPFAAPIYFLYVAPVALIAGIAAVRSMPAGHRLGDGPAAAAVLLFALLSLNRGYVWNVGAEHEVHRLDAPLELPRAHLKVADDEAAIFNTLVPLVMQHLGDRGLVAGPDTPDVYFLTGQFSPSGRLFDFFSGQTAIGEEQRLAEWTRADVIVLFHGRRFSPPLPEGLISRLRQEFPQGESVPPFEVRWR